MNPCHFPQANIKYGPPPDLEESQCAAIPAFVHEVRGGSCDGVPQVVVCWKPTDEEIEAIKNGAPIYLSVLGNLPPHYLSVDFEQATHPA